MSFCFALLLSWKSGFSFWPFVGVFPKRMIIINNNNKTLKSLFTPFFPFTSPVVHQ